MSAPRWHPHPHPHPHRIVRDERQVPGRGNLQYVTDYPGGRGGVGRAESATGTSFARHARPGRTGPATAETKDTRDTYKTLDLALRIGEVLLSSGAGAADVGATMLSVAHSCGLRGSTADVTSTELEMSHQTSFDEPALIQVRHVQYRDIDYEDLTMVDHLVRDLVNGSVSRDQARNRLARVVSSGHRLPRCRSPSAGVPWGPGWGCWSGGAGRSP